MSTPAHSACLKKRMYWTEIQAKNAIGRCEKRGTPDKLRTYKCLRCPRWHLTKNSI